MFDKVRFLLGYPEPSGDAGDAGFDVHIQTKGVAANRRFAVTWRRNRQRHAVHFLLTGIFY